MTDHGNKTLNLKMQQHLVVFDAATFNLRFLQHTVKQIKNLQQTNEASIFNKPSDGGLHTQKILVQESIS